MVKKGQGKGGKASSGPGEKSGNAASNRPDDSFIIFSNSDKDPKPKKPTGSSDVSKNNLEPSGLIETALAGEASKRPDVKKLIGGASWTGKLPVNLLSEHCQKQKWEKPEYTMVGHPKSIYAHANFADWALKSPRRLMGTYLWLF
jgi:ATP-dependent RNA helicase DHX57